MVNSLISPDRYSIDIGQNIDADIRRNSSFKQISGIVHFVEMPLKGRFVVFSHNLFPYVYPLRGALTLRGQFPNPAGHSPNPT